MKRYEERRKTALKNLEAHLRGHLAEFPGYTKKLSEGHIASHRSELDILTKRITNCKSGKQLRLLAKAKRSEKQREYQANEATRKRMPIEELIA